MNALESLSNGSRSGKREQRIYTPPAIVDALRVLWPEGVMLDPCSGPDSIVPAELRVMPPQQGCKYLPEPTIPGWCERTYVNPPFDALEPWIRQFVESDECVLLVPVRSHRRWWRPLIPCSRICWLDPLKFVGFDATFPAPLALCYRGARDFASATKGLGDVL